MGWVRAAPKDWQAVETILCGLMSRFYELPELVRACREDHARGITTHCEIGAAWSLLWDDPERNPLRHKCTQPVLGGKP